MCRHIAEGVLQVCWPKGIVKAKRWGEAHRSCRNKGLLSSWTKKQTEGKASSRYVPGTNYLSCSSPWLWASLMIVAQVQTLIWCACPQPASFPICFSQCTCKTPFTYVYTSFVSDLEPAKSIAVNENVEADWTGQYILATLCVGTLPSLHNRVHITY